MAGSGIARIVAARQAPAFVSSTRPSVEYGIQIGDVTGDRAIIWSRTDREARMYVEWDTTPKFKAPNRVRGLEAVQSLDYTARLDLEGLPNNENIFLRVTFEDPNSIPWWSSLTRENSRTSSCPGVLKLSLHRLNGSFILGRYTPDGTYAPFLKVFRRELRE